ncbi:MAG: phage holin family protein [Candidatus Berkelbacteria bacterium]|nr:phage holin family protein [Candidatus Berkelbacteria bacterium]
MDKNLKTFLIFTAVVAIVAGGLVVAAMRSGKTVPKQTPENLAELAGQVAGVSTQDDNYSSDYIAKLAKYMTQNGMTMYGAASCSHCQEQKAEFGDAVKYIDYVECDPTVADNNSDECTARKITSYPTWIYQGQKYEGVKSLSDLAKICNFSN